MMDIQPADLLQPNAAPAISRARQMAEQLGVALPVVEMTLVHYRRLMEAGFGDEDISALFREKRALFGPDDSRPARP